MIANRGWTPDDLLSKIDVARRQLREQPNRRTLSREIARWALTCLEYYARLDKELDHASDCFARARENAADGDHDAAAEATGLGLQAQERAANAAKALKEGADG